MGLDVRLPLGLLFVTIGALLAMFGALGDKSIYAISLGINVNLWWGLVMLLVGTTFLWLSRRRAVATETESSVPDAARTDVG
jgi:hypothetical protein